MKNSLVWLIIITLCIIIATLSYVFIPYIRYKLIPITGGTQAPESLDSSTTMPTFTGFLFTSLLAHKSDTVEEMVIKPGIFADKKGVIDTINKVPEQDGWINSTHLDLATLEAQNKVILIDFWTYTCINCIRAAPYTQELWNRYKDYGLVIIGVHSPEFKVESNPKHIYAAIKKAGITYPVLTDAHMLIWRKFGNHFWPGKYLINPQGLIVYTQFGEGNYQEEELTIRRHLERAGWKLPPYKGTPKFLEPTSKKVTPELYAGPSFIRRPYGNTEQPELNDIAHFTLPSTLKPDTIYLEGSWKGFNDYVESASSAKILLSYQANALYVVFDTTHKSSEVEVLLDNQPLNTTFKGKDIKIRDNKTFMYVTGPRLYYPISDKAPYGRHTITFKVPQGIRLYSFTFGVY